MKVAVAQISCLLGDPEANLLKVRDFSRRAKEVGAELIVFPEMIDTGDPGERRSLGQGIRSRASKNRQGVFNCDRQRRFGAEWFINLQFPGSYRFAWRYRWKVSQDSSVCSRTGRRTDDLCFW